MTYTQDIHNKHEKSSLFNSKSWLDLLRPSFMSLVL